MRLKQRFGRHSRFSGSVAGGLLAVGVAAMIAGCGGAPRSDVQGTEDGGGGGDDGGGVTGDLGRPEADMSLGRKNECGDWDPSCTGVPLGPPVQPFPLSSDPNPDSRVTDNGVDRDADGYLVLGASRASFDFLWIANSGDWGRGTVSKINSKRVREVARYVTVTCFSNPEGSRGACDGIKGCCSRDDYDRFNRRAAGQAAGAHQPVQEGANSPSRTAVDFNGDVWIANRAFGGQSSVTKIANDLADCAERNGTPGIQTSGDVNNDGLIDSDCNRNGVPDDIADVTNKACANGKPQEFYGADDECILFTTNTNSRDQYGRPLALGRGAADVGPADAWAGCYQDGRFFRVDGTTGTIKATAKLIAARYGATVDSKGILWATGVGGGAQLAYFDTGKPSDAGTVRMPGFGTGGYGITMDRDQNVWIGGYPGPHAYRYTPDRGGDFAQLGKGFWTMVTNTGQNSGANGCNGRGIAADSRTPGTYFVWMACHGAPFIARIDASKIPLPMGMDVQVDGRAMPAMRIAGGSIAGAGVDIEQNIWSVASSGSVATRIKVDVNGNMTAPDLTPGGDGDGCPVGKGDRCTLKFNPVGSDPAPYTYSDFTGFGLRNFTNPKGTYAFVVRGCKQGETRWMRVVWDAETPANTKVTVRARTGDVPFPDMSWGAWSGAFSMSPGDFAGVLGPNPADFIQVQFDLSTADRTTSPKLKSFKVLYECSNAPG